MSTNHLHTAWLQALSVKPNREAWSLPWRNMHVIHLSLAWACSQRMACSAVRNILLNGTDVLKARVWLMQEALWCLMLHHQDNVFCWPILCEFMGTKASGEKNSTLFYTLSLPSPGNYQVGNMLDWESGNWGFSPSLLLASLGPGTNQFSFLGLGFANGKMMTWMISKGIFGTTEEFEIVLFFCEEALPGTHLRLNPCSHLTGKRCKQPESPCFSLLPKAP